jgi:hypothetical protein
MIAKIDDVENDDENEHHDDDDDDDDGIDDHSQRVFYFARGWTPPTTRILHYYGSCTLW